MKNNTSTPRNYEKTGLRISIAGSVLLSSSAIIMALVAKSQAILLDGLYTFVTLVMALVSLRVVDLVNMPETRTRPFGYMALEPFLNLIKSLVMLVLLTLFLITNIQELCTGGRRIAVDMTTLYMFICLVIYAVIILLLKKCERRVQSSILDLEIRNWKIDAMQTAGIAGSLVIAMILLKRGHTTILPYIDPLIVIALVLVSLPVPVKVLANEFKRLVLISPENRLEREVKQQLADIAREFSIVDIQVWGLKSGRTHYLFLYCDLENDQTTLDTLDRIRRAMFKQLALVYPVFWADIMFTRINPETPFYHVAGVDHARHEPACSPVPPAAQS